MRAELVGELQHYPMLEDEVSLVARARRGDVSALDEIYRQHRDQVYTLCLNLCSDRELAQDLLQETFVRAFRGISSFAGRSQLSTWLYRIAVNLAHEVARRQRFAEKTYQSPTQPDTETVDRVRATLGSLRENYRIVLALRYTQTLSYQEIAECLGWSLARVKVTIHRAKQEFREAYLKGEG